ncbi:biotin transporter BioY [Demequina pelophila]|uniref:biotin transporter BioY n=1 Tax=Demequina pelophila TaxID=1638984 RepID=UPI0007843467|nr:biotin transporter BioY [Demequina pelophila]
MSLHRHLTGQNIALVAVFAAVIAASTLVPEFTLLGGVPITLQTFAVVLAGLVLGPWRALAAVSLYLLMGLMGAPIFANGVAGIVVLSGPTGGYLFGFILAATAIGFIARALARRGLLHRRVWSAAMLAAAGLVSLPLVYAVGVPWLAWRTGMPVMPVSCTGLTDSDCVSAVTVGVIPFIVPDLIKVAAAGVVAAAVHRTFPGLLGRARVATRATRDDARVALAEESGGTATA